MHGAHLFPRSDWEGLAARSGFSPSRHTSGDQNQHEEQPTVNPLPQHTSPPLKEHQHSADHLTSSHQLYLLYLHNTGVTAGLV